MSKKRADKEFIEDILESIQRILHYTQGMGWNDFITDPKTQDAVIRNLEIIGEAAKRLSDDSKSKHTSIPWRDMAGIRDKLIHHYFGVNYEVLWNIVTINLPDLEPEIRNLYNKLESK